MDVQLSPEALEFGRQARRAWELAGGDTLVQHAEQNPHLRQGLIEPILESLGAWDLSPRRDADELDAAAALCRSAGYWAVPYPVAERLARPDRAGSDGLVADGLLVVSAHDPRGPVAGLDFHWAAVTLDGTPGNVTVTHDDSPPRQTAFTAPLHWRPAGHATVAGVRAGTEHAAVGGELVAAGRGRATDGRANGAGTEAPASVEDTARDLALGLVLPCWTLLGMLDRAMDLARSHVLVREQFGRPLAEFQAVQFQLTEAEVERRGVDMLARYALCGIASGDSGAVDDGLALRLAALEAAEVVFRVAHQLHGALGFCDESPLSWLSRYSLPLRRLPLGSAATEELLARRIGRRGLTGLFSAPGNAKGA
ncbi:acyl-CoA dehydrogenase family protein [Nocardia jejuensis]|uniref:acyl-CoA dehydrogenase family protein n=1 Tax=Nocardia jejuensis TaxID=328049 RepID=UPI0008333CD6|nr:acyl-CoA dehydrogenase family protein [Nocardia jejuensis]